MYNPFHTAPISKVVILISPLMSVATYGSSATALDVGLRGKNLRTLLLNRDLKMFSLCFVITSPR